jgi:hypothetical protein
MPKICAVIRPECKAFQTGNMGHIDGCPGAIFKIMLFLTEE